MSSCIHRSRPSFHATLPPVRRYTITLLTASQPPAASASSAMLFSGSALPPRICSSEVTSATAPTSTSRSLQRLRREAAEHDRMRRADARARLHRDDAFDRHRHIDHHAVALLHAALLQRVREAADALQQVLIRDVGDGAVVGFEDDRVALAVAGFDVTVDAVVRRVELAVFEPRVERRVRFVEHLREGLVPAERLAGEARPEAFVIALGFGGQRPVRVHAGDRGTCRCFAEGGKTRRS